MVKILVLTLTAVIWQTVEPCISLGGLCARASDCCQPLTCQITQKPFPQFRVRDDPLEDLKSSILTQVPSQHTFMLPAVLLAPPKDQNRTFMSVGASTKSSRLALRCRKHPVMPIAYE